MFCRDFPMKFELFIVAIFSITGKPRLTLDSRLPNGQSMRETILRKVCAAKIGWRAMQQN